MKRILAVFLALTLTFLGTACGKAEGQKSNAEPNVSQMKAICELAVMECYYHNVAKFVETDAWTFLWVSKDKHFWIEYSGIVKLGVDASLIDLKIDDTQVTITMPKAKVQGCKVDSTSLTKDSYIVDKDSVEITAEDETMALNMAQSAMEESAANDKTLLGEAQQRAQILLEDYVHNIGSTVNKEYTIKWIYVDDEGTPLGNSDAKSSESEQADTTGNKE